MNPSDELDAIMTAFPLGPFTEIEVSSLTDIVISVERPKQVM